jgi:hypothetical protein
VPCRRNGVWNLHRMAVEVADAVVVPESHRALLGITVT